MSNPSNRKRPLVADKRSASKAKTKAKAKPAARKPRKTARRKTPVRRGGIVGLVQRLLRWIFGLIWKITWRIGMVAGLLLALAVGYYYTTLPDVTELLDGRARGSVTLLDRDSKVFAWRGDQFGGVVTTNTVSPHLKNAIIATEDKRFYSHFGMSPRGVASAIRINLSEGRGPLSGHGGSTITQQVAKLLCIGVPFDPEVQTEEEYESECRRGTIQRKAREALYALALEAKYSKDEILTIYLNRAYLGAGSRGFEAAARLQPSSPAALANLAASYNLAGRSMEAANAAQRALTLDHVQVLVLDEADHMFDMGFLPDVRRILRALPERRAAGWAGGLPCDHGRWFCLREGSGAAAWRRCSCSAPAEISSARPSVGQTDAVEDGGAIR